MQENSAEGIIVLRGAAPGYPGRAPVLSGVSVSALPGEMVAIVGRNGSGKSTLLRTLAGILPLMTGECLLNGSPLKAYGTRKRAGMISLVSSRIPEVPAMNIRELVSLGRIPHTGWSGRLAGEDLHRIDEALEKLGLEGLALRQVDRVSDGERQRALIARALVQDTPVMLLDEPTAFLDLPGTFGLTRVLEEFRKSGKTLVYATHDFEMALGHADRLWVIDDGRVEEGGPEDLGLSGLYDRLFMREGITFDPAALRFTTRARWRGTAVVSGGEEPARDWTGNALRRAGFLTGEGPGTPDEGLPRIRVEISGIGPLFRWNLQKGGKEYTFDRIYSLVQFLTRDELFSNFTHSKNP